jgi:hypothetical protein
MSSKNVALSLELCAKIDEMKGRGQSYDGFVRGLLGMDQAPSKRKPVVYSEEFQQINRLQVGENTLLAFELQEPDRDKDGNITHLYPASNAARLGRLVKRAEEVHPDWKIISAGEVRGLRVWRLK